MFVPWNYTGLKKYVIPASLYFQDDLVLLMKLKFCRFEIGPLHDPVTCCDTNNTVGLPTKRNYYQSSPTFFYFKSPTALLSLLSLLLLLLLLLL